MSDDTTATDAADVVAAPGPDAPAPRGSAWRRHGLPVLRMFAWFGAFTAAYGLGQVPVAVALAQPGLEWFALPATALVVAVLLAAYVAAVRWIEGRRPVEDLAPGPAARELGLGVLLGAGAFCTAIGLLVAGGLYTVRHGDPLTRTGTALAIALVSGVGEEIIFRGILQRRLTDRLGTYGAIAATSLFFGLAHLANPAATLWSTAAIAVEAGVMLGLAYVATGRLWVPIGLHAAWNYAQGGIFGVAVSGNLVGPSLLHSAPAAGRDALTGGAFGVEASPAALVACLVVSVALWLVVRRRGLVVPPPWRRPAA